VKHEALVVTGISTGWTTSAKKLGIKVFILWHRLCFDLVLKGFHVDATICPDGRIFSTGSCQESVLKGDHVASPGCGSGFCRRNRLPQNATAAEPAAMPKARHLKHVDAHIQQTIILHNIVMNIEIEVTSLSCLVEHIT
jgi:hypothetical protein